MEAAACPAFRLFHSGDAPSHTMYAAPARVAAGSPKPAVRTSQYGAFGSYS